MTHSHRAPTSPLGPLRRMAGRLGQFGVGFLCGAILAGGGGIAVAAATGALSPGQYPCTKVEHADGGFAVDCDAPAPNVSPTASPSPTATPSPTASPTATPTPTATGGPLLTGCFDRLAACGYPHPGNTGVPAGTALTAYTGPATIRTAGTVIEGKTMGCIAIEAANVVLRRVRITGPCFYGIDMRSGSLAIEDSEVNCVDGRGTGIAWARFAARRVYVHDCENALEMGQGASVVDSYLFAREATSAGHGDGIQSQGGNDVVIRHNTFAGVNPITSSIITNPTLNSRWTIESNFLSSGAYTLYCAEQGTSWTVRGNRFYPAKTGNPHSASYGLTDECNDPSITWSGNYRDDNLASVSSTA